MYFFRGFFFISSDFQPNSTVLVSCFPEFMENTTKHLENWCPHVFIPRQKNSTDTFRGFQKVGFQWEKTDEQVIFVWENSDFRSENRNENLEGSH
jgi:hypothetical protein